MDGQHQGRRSRRRPRVAITAVEHASPQAVFHAFFTDTAIPEEGCSGAEEPVIMKGLHHRDTCFATRRVNRGRDHDEGVMDMDEVWILPAQQLAKISPRVVSPDGPARQRQLFKPGVGFHLPITSTVGYDLVPGALQESAFLIENHILTARLLVLVMHNDYFHDF